MTEQSNDRQREIDERARRLRNLNIRRARNYGRRGRERGQKAFMNPFSAITQPSLFAAWNEGYVEEQ